MRKAFVVARQELFTTFTRPSFLLFAFGVPILIVLIMGVVKLIQNRSGPSSTPIQNTTSEYHPEKEGFVDHSGLVQTIPPNLQAYLIPFATETQALQALEAGEINAYYVIPADYIARGEVDYIFPDDRSYLSDGQKWVIQWTMILNLLGGDLELADQIWNPVLVTDRRSLAAEQGNGTVSGEDCSQPGTACESNELIRLMPSLMVAVFFFAFINSSSLLFNSIGAEKENRTIELLMLVIHPRQLLIGKTLALGLAGLSQTVVWLGSIYILFNLGGSTLSLPEDFQFPAIIAAWGLAYFAGGFGLYASLMAGAGALVPRLKEAGIASFVALSPLFFGYVFGIMAPLVEATGSAILVFLSVFPLTSPIVMVMRLTDGAVPLWQLLLSIVMLYVTVYYTIQLIAAMFIAQNLLSGQPFSARRFLFALVGRNQSRSAN